MSRVMSASFGVSRYLTSLKAGGAMVKDDMIILPHGACQSMRDDAEYVCAKDDRYDWCFETDKRSAA